MQILGTGIDYSTGDTLVQPFDEEAFGQAVQQALSQRAAEIQRVGAIRSGGTAMRGEVRRERTTDLGDPAQAGWTYLVHRDDPQREALDRALAEHRHMEDGGPLVYGGEPPEDWQGWMQDHYFGRQLEGRKVPHYVLFVGSAERIPFHFQALFDSAASVGRVDFDTPAELQAYVEKLLRLERGTDPVTAREAVFFATDAGAGDATHFSRRFMADPLAQHVTRACRIPTHLAIADDALKEGLLEDARQRRPALVYTATHGMAAPRETLAVQKRVNGGICCQHLRGDARDEWLLTADDIDPAAPFFEGAVFFQFACFGYGTPSESDFRHWFGGAELNSEQSFVAAFPRRLLSHPRGPIAFVGHVDTAWLHGFNDPDNPYLAERWSARIAPYKTALDTILACQPVGLAMSDLNKRFDYANAELTLTFDRMVRGRLEVTPALHKRLANTFIFRSDAQNYMVFGDPAAHARIPEG